MPTTLAGAYPQDFAALFDRLVNVQRIGRSDAERPRLELVLESGSVLAGVLVATSNGMLRLEDERKVSFVRPSSVAAVTVLDGPSHLDILSGGRAERGGDAPGALGLSKKAKALSDRLHRRIDVDIPSSETQRLALSRLLDELGAALDHIVTQYGDEFSVESIRVESGVPGVEREGTTLVVRAWLDGGVSGRLSGAALVKAIEKAC